MMKKINAAGPTNTLRLTLICACLWLVMLACNLANLPRNRLPTETPGSTLTPIQASVTPALIAAAASGTPGPTAVPAIQTPTGAGSCYVGSWELTNISDLVGPILAQNNIQNVQLTGSSGSLIFLLNPDGKITLTASQFHSLFYGKLGFFPVTVDVLILGKGSGNYSLDQNDSLLLSNSDFGGITVSAVVASITIIPTTPITHFIPALGSDLNGQVYSLKTACSGDRLTLDTGGLAAGPLIFSRIQP